MVQAPRSPQLLYPDSDGQPMAENTVQYDWIVRLVANLKYLLRDRTAFVAGDLLWYPVQVTEPPVPCQAPDAMVAFDRPPGRRGSYKQWEEAGIAPQVVFEIISPSNTPLEMLKKLDFYRQYGVLEFYLYNPDQPDFMGYVRSSVDHDFESIMPLSLPWSSPLLGIQFTWSAAGLAVFHPDGEPFKDPGDILAERDAAQAERDAVQRQRDRAFAKLRELGIDPSTLDGDLDA
jgi:Uma2 family endonuclease